MKASQLWREGQREKALLKTKKRIRNIEKNLAKKPSRYTEKKREVLKRKLVFLYGRILTGGEINGDINNKT